MASPDGLYPNYSDQDEWVRPGENETVAQTDRRYFEADHQRLENN